MISEEEYRLLMLGVPATGKTSFLAALWHLVTSDSLTKEWDQYKYSADTEYLSAIHTRWLTCKQQDRTTQQQNKSRNVELYLEHKSTGKRLSISVPDIEGEQFSQQWALRSWSEDYNDLVKNANGLIYFIHPNRIKMPTLLTNTASLTEEFFDEDIFASEVLAWKPELAPSQVIAVDLLQFHLPPISNNLISTVVIIVSAWDDVLIDAPVITPVQWLEYNMPLLYQYLRTNSDKLKFSIFGVSAQGGNYEQEEIQTKLAALEEPAERIIVQHSENKHNNLMAPIEWSMQEWKSLHN